MDLFDNITYTIDSRGRIDVDGNLVINSPMFDQIQPLIFNTVNGDIIFKGQQMFIDGWHFQLVNGDVYCNNQY